MKLYRVACEIEYDVLCLAESEEDAMRACQDGYAEEELRVRSFWDVLSAYPAREITTIDQVPTDWRGSLVYHKGKEDITIEDALSSCESSKESAQ